ncbi:MAG: polysaccharide deacetylase family protein [Candidatus Doudnabacteria bacterium]|nr:polysaccharide deacetylase family protein [Candidatus Doudnabacteria bacterium]
MKYIRELGRILFVAGLLIIFGVFTRPDNSAPVFSTPPVSELPAEINIHPAAQPGIPRSVRVPVLMYHHIGEMPSNPDRYRRDLTVSTADFEAEVKFLYAAGYSCISTQALYQYQQGEVDLAKKPCVIIFDDGFDDAFKNAIPTLLKYRMTGSFAVITQYVANSEYASWPTILGAQTVGMEIVSHSQHHIDFTSRKYSHQDKINEIQGSLKDIQAHLHTAPITFVYPYGHHDLETEAIVAGSGFKMAFTTAPGFYGENKNAYEMPRVRVHGVEGIDRFAESLGITLHK